MRHKRPCSKEKDSKVNALTLGKLHPNIICRLCRGYIIDCITIVECMHSFCRSCIIRYLNDQEDDRYECPKCGQIIHETNPWSYLAPDSALQTIIYKLVPGLQETEDKRYRDFYRRKGISPPPPRDERVVEKVETQKFKKNVSDKKTESESYTIPSDNNHRFDEQISVHLMSSNEWASQKEINGLEEADNENLAQCTADGKAFRPFLRLSCFATVNHLRKYLAYRLQGDIDQYSDFELFCEGRPLYKEHTLKFIAATVWGHIVDHSEEGIDLVMPIVYQKNTAASEGTDLEEGDNEEDNATAISDSTANLNNSNSALSPV